MQRGAIVGRRSIGTFHVVAVRLVDRDQVGELDHALFDALQFIAGAGHEQDEKYIGHARYGRLRLADADGLHDHDVEAGGLAQQHRFARARRDAAQRSARRATAA